MWFPKFPYTNFSQINLDWVLKQVKELTEWMNRYFKDIRQDLDDEINNRIEGDKALGKRIDQEITDRTEADQQLQNNIDAEEAARKAADTALGGRIDKEIQDRTAADTALGQRIDTETSERKAADQQLQSNIDALRSDAILKDGSTTTTAPIPFAQGIKTGSIAELSPDAGVSIEAQLDMNSHKITALADGSDDADAVNVGQMNTADDQAVQEAVEEANSYTDSQLESFAADVHSIPAGGASGQVLAKVDGTNYNVTWVDQQGGGSGGDVPAGGTTGQVLAKATDADYQTEWVNQPEGLPAGGTEGQVVTKTADGVEWANAPSGYKLVQTTENYDLYANEDGFATVVGKKLIIPPGLGNILDHNGYFTWGLSFTYTDLSDPAKHIPDEYTIKNGDLPNPITWKALFINFNSTLFTTEPIQMLSAEISTNHQGYFICTYRIINPTNFTLKSIDEIMRVLNDGRSYTLTYRYK